MTFVNQVGNALTGATGSGNFVGATSPTITTPKIGQINDTNGNGVLGLSTAASAVNYLQFTNSATSAPLLINAIGSDTNIGIQEFTKGTGTFDWYSTATSNQFAIHGGTGYQSVVIWNLPNVSQTLTIAAGSVSGTLGVYTTGSFTPVFTSSGGGTATYSVQSGSYTQIGPLVFFQISLSLTGLPSAGNVTITGLPVTALSNSPASIWANALQATVTSPINIFTNPGTSVISLYKFATGSNTALTVADCTTGSQFLITGFYST